MYNVDDLLDLLPVLADAPRETLAAQCNYELGPADLQWLITVRLAHSHVTDHFSTLRRMLVLHQKVCTANFHWPAHKTGEHHDNP